MDGSGAEAEDSGTIPGMAEREADVVDDEMARVLRGMTGAERLRIASGMFASARRMIASHLAAEHPDWDQERIERETARRISHGAV